MSKEKFYKQVIIFGPDWNGAFADDIKMAPSGDDMMNMMEQQKE